MTIDPEKRYQIAIELYKHYNEIILKGTAFLYSILSGSVAFYIANQNIEKINFILLLAFLTGIGSILLFIFSISLLHNVKTEIEEIAKELNLSQYPSIRPICWFLRLNILGMLLFLSVGVCIFLN